MLLKIPLRLSFTQKCNIVTTYEVSIICVDWNHILLTKAGHRDPEVRKYEHFVYCYIYSQFVINICFITTLNMFVIQNYM